MGVEARFTAIELVDADRVRFTLESRAGITACFEQSDFRDFVTRAKRLVVPYREISDTDELLHIWFSFEPEIAF